MGSSSRRPRSSLLVASAISTVVGMLILTIRSIDLDRPITSLQQEEEEDQAVDDKKKKVYKSSSGSSELHKKSLHEMQPGSRPRLVLVSDSPSIVKDIKPILQNFTEDWGPAPRWVAFVDFFLASRAKHAVISGAHRRVGTTYAQLIAALAAAHSVVENTSASSNFSFLSSFQNNLLLEGLRNQVGWGHVWNRFAGPLSCHNQSTQCAFTPLLPPAWWDGLWQSPIPRDIRRMKAFGVQLSGFGSSNDEGLHSYCDSRKTYVVTVTLI